MARENRITSPSTPVNNRAFIECDSTEFMVVAAVQAIHWATDEDEEAGIDAICQLMPRVGRRSIERAVASLKKRKTLFSERSFGRPSRFGLSFEDLTGKAMRALLQNRQLGVIETAKVAEIDRQLGGVIKTTDSKEQTVKKTTPLQQEANTLEAIYKAAWEGRYTRSQYLAVPADQKRFLAWAKAHIKPEVFSAKVARLMEREEPWVLQHRHSTWLLESDWNKLETEELAPREACKHPLDRMKDVKDYGPQIYGTCGVCGHKGYHMKESE